MSMHTLGAYFDGSGVHFCVYSKHAENITLCLLDNGVETRHLPMQFTEGFLWKLYVPGCEPGQHYGYRAAGRFAPQEGHYFNSAKLLVDPYAREIRGEFNWHRSTLNHAPEHMDFSADSAAHVPYSVVTDPIAPITVPRPFIPWENTVIYEAHVKGLTCLHPEIPAAQRGRYAGLCHPVMLEYYRRLGITSLQLLPVQHCLDELHLYQTQRINYWGYNTLAWFAPTPRYAEHNAIVEFRHMVDTLHHAGIEVLLDVVFNHSAEGGERGPTLSLRGLDNATYYRMNTASPHPYANDSGCGNTLEFDHPAVIRLVMDCLRFWAGEMGVDGFRFDLASVLSRRKGRFDAQHPLWLSILQDPLLAPLKWIVEPWDLGEGGYQLGNYPEGFSEWNDQFRDQIRCFVRGNPAHLGNFAKRVAGSWDIFRKAGVGARTSINYITAHDGFTLKDLVTYSQKHNFANGELNRDGSDENFSANYGVEGETDIPQIVQLRARQQRNFIVLLGLSQGTPMLTQGDESGRTQHGNNNAYCQDTPTSWCHWPVPDPDLLAFTVEVFRLRRALHIGCVYKTRDALWQQINHCFRFYRSDAKLMSHADWQHDPAHSLALLFQTPVTRVLLLVNFNFEEIFFVLPAPNTDKQWCLRLDTHTVSLPLCHPQGLNYHVQGRSIALLTEESA